MHDAIKDDHKQQSGGAEVAEPSAYDRLLNSRDGLYDLFQARSRAIRDGLNASSFFHSSAASQLFTRGKASQSNRGPNSEQEYDIDPITNRKVYRKSADTSNRAQFDPSREVLERSETTLYQPYFAHEPDGKYAAREQDGLREFDADESYTPYFAYEPDGKMPEPSDTVQESLKEFDSGESYKPYFAYEPDGKKSDLEKDGLQEYESGVSYEPYFAYEPDGKMPTTVEEGLKEYETGVTYEPFFAYEPDGKMAEEVTDSSMRTTESCPVQEGLKDHDEKVSYGAVRYREPDGKLPEEPCPVQEGLKAYDNITAYEPRPVNHPANNFDLAKSAATGGLHDFCCRMTYGTIPRSHSSDHTSTSGGQSFPQNQSDTREDLDLLRSSDVRASAGHSKGPKRETAAEKQAKRQELEEQYQKLSIENSELQNIASHLKGRIDAKISDVSSELPAGSSSKMTGNYVRDFPEEFEGKWTASTDGSETLSPKPRVDAWGYDNSPQGLEVSYEQEVQNAERDFIEGRASTEAFSSKPEVSRIQTSLERSSAADGKATTDNPAQEVREIRARYLGNTDSAAVKLQNEHDLYSKEPQGLETHFVEERQRETEMDPYSKNPQGLETHFAEEQKLENKLEVEKDPYSNEPQGLETHFETERRLEAEKDSYSTRPQGLETSYAEECAAEAYPLSGHSSRSKEQDRELVREVRGIYEDTYGKIDSQHRQGLEASSAPQPAENRVPDVEPTLYTILAYDPATKSVSTAETTSIVHDSAPAITPAEALLQISNPAKFIPHFGSLQAAGYEIVSGSGDVLIWRKVRPSSPMSHLASTKNMNPIDGMRSTPIATTGNFASPTGFVNHDLLEDSDHNQFRSNIDVCRVEDVFSGGKPSWVEESEGRRGKKTGRGKKILIGAAWLGGLSYTVGVVAEYFKTGGSDGLGPQGF
jgi:hypothetical protein